MAPLRLDDVAGFVFDLDGTLIHRARGGGFEVEPGAAEVLAAIRASGRPFVIFTNASHVGPGVIAAELRAAGLEVADDEVLTAACSSIAYLRERYDARPVAAFATAAMRERLVDSGIELVDGEAMRDAAVVFVATPEAFSIEEIEHAARAILGGARLTTGSYVPAYAGADGPIFSRGAMVTAALAKVTGRRPMVLGKPSRAAVRETVNRLGIASERLAVIGDDVILDVGLGHLGGSRTILVRSGISAGVDPTKLPPNRRPDHTITAVAALLRGLSP